MLTLSYSACYDPYNTIFRMLVLLAKSADNTMHVETLKIADFFLCFPVRLTEIKAPNSVKGMRGRCNKIIRELKTNEFEILPGSEILFERMDIIQETSISAMFSKGIVRITGAQDDRIVTLDTERLSEKLLLKANKFASENISLINLLAEDFNNISIKGVDGLKARTGLGDFVYDTV